MDKDELTARGEGVRRVFEEAFNRMGVRGFVICMDDEGCNHYVHGISVIELQGLGQYMKAHIDADLDEFVGRRHGVVLGEAPIPAEVVEKVIRAAGMVGSNAPECETCGVRHAKNVPHAVESPQFQTFWLGKTGKKPCFNDAAFDMPDADRMRWKAHLEKRGFDPFAEAPSRRGNDAGRENVH